MICPKCKSNETIIVDSRAYENTTRRRRSCNECGERWSTIEVLVEEHVRMVAANKQMQSIITQIQDALDFGWEKQK